MGRRSARRVRSIHQQFANSIFPRMVKLTRAISLAIMDEYGSVEPLRRFADPLRV